MIPAKKKYTIGFRHALAGLSYALVTQQNFVFHLFASLVVLFLSFYFKINLIELAIVILTIFIVLIVEIFNSAIEIWVDSGIQDINIYAKRVKDLSAAAVLLASLCAVVIGFIIFLPYLIPLISA